MKYAILALLLVIAQTTPPTPRKRPDNSTQTPAKIQNKSKNQEANRSPALTPPNTKSDGSPESNGGNKHSKDTTQAVSISELPPVAVIPAKRDAADWAYWVFNFLLVVVGAFQVVLLFLTLKVMGRQTIIQEATTTQWLELLPDGLLTEAHDDNVPPQTVTINPKWRIVNKTSLPFTIENVETRVGRDEGWEVSKFDVDEVVPPLGDGQNYFSFFVPTLLTETETTDFLARGIELSIAIDITYIGTSGKRSRQGFGDFYVCRVGNLEINKPIGKGPQSQEIEKYEGESTLVASKVRILEEAQESLPKPSAQKHPKLRKK